MKLIDILVQELPKRGGWPDESACVTQDDNGALCFWKDNEVQNVANYWCHPTERGLTEYRCEGQAVSKSDDRSKVIITREQYEAALKQLVWDGMGAPPVGVECEWQDKNTKKWVEVLVVYASEWVTVIRENKPVDPVELAIENYGDEARRQFRPIRSERDKVVHAIAELCRSSASNGHSGDLIYDAIAAGEIPGVKLSE